MFLKKRLKNLLTEEDGSSLVEFALVLPMLIVLTVGGVYLSVSFGQKSMMNGLSFMELRSASVRSVNERKQTVDFVVDRYVKNSSRNQEWIKKIESKFDNVNENDLGIILSKDALNTDILANSIAILSGQKTNHTGKIKKISSAMIMNNEFIDMPGNNSDRPNTSTTVNYKTAIIGIDKVKDMVKPIVSILPEKLAKETMDALFDKNFVDTKEDYPDHLTSIRDDILGTNPANNMYRVNKFYDYWGLDKNYNPAATNAKASEAPLNGFNNLTFMRETADKVKLIETSSNIISLILEIYAMPAFAAMPAAMVVLEYGEKAATKVADIAELNNNRMFKKRAIGP